MDIGEFIRQRFREAKAEARWSQREMAALLGVSQSTVSDIERGRVRITADDLARFTGRLQKPITYFYPAGMEADDDKEADLLNLFRSLPQKWKQHIMSVVKRECEVYELVRPYERVGIPDEFYWHLVLDMDQEWKMSQELDWPEPTEEEIRLGYDPEMRRYHEEYAKWRSLADSQVKEESLTTQDEKG